MGNSNNGGARPGAGRPRGAVSQRTIDRMTAKRRFVDRVIKHTDDLFNAQLDKAIGEKHLMVKITEYVKDKKTGENTRTIKRQWHEIITDPQTILAFLDGELEHNDQESINDDENFYYLTTKPADNMAIANMLDRSYGKPTEKVELGASDDADLSDLSEEELQERLNARIDAYLKSRNS